MPVTNAQYDAIMRRYGQKQLNAKRNLDQHYAEIYKKYPDIQQLDQKISAISVDRARKLLNGDESALDTLRSELKETTARRSSLLAQYGYPPDYLEPHYECPHCQDTGYVENQKCKCFRQAVIDLLYTQSNLEEILKLENFDTYTDQYYSPNYIDKATGLTARELMKKAKETSLDFIRHFDQEFRNLLLYGETGTGKTFLSHCIAKELIDREHSVIYLPIYQLYDILQKNKFSDDQDAARSYSYILDCDLLIIDDLGTEMANNFILSELFFCLNERLIREKSTIISTNLSLKGLKEQYSERISSRITSAYTLLKFAGDDIRIKKKLQIHQN